MFNVGESIEILTRTPAILDSWLRGLSPAWCEASEGPGKWTPREVLSHLLQGEEEDWIVRAQIILAGDPSKTFTPFEREKFRALYPGLSVEALLDRFREKRRESLVSLKAMQVDAGKLALVGTHPAFGPVTMRELLATWVVHDLNHLRQIARVMAKRYGGDVGPWRQYLPVLEE